MMKSTLVFFFFLAITSIARGHDSFVKKFAYTQVMSNCLGEETYYGWMKKVIAAKKQCYSEPVKMLRKQGVQRQEEMVTNLADLLKGDRPLILPLLISKDGTTGNIPFQIPLDLLSRRHKREALFDGSYLKQLLTKAVSKASNFTCVLQKMNYVDEDLRILPEVMKSEVKNLTASATLNADMVKIIDHCTKFSMCLPDETFPMPIQVKRLLAFVKCEKKLRMAICMKQHILKNMDHFDVSGIPLEGSDQEEMAEKILHILWGSEAKEDFEIY